MLKFIKKSLVLSLIVLSSFVNASCLSTGLTGSESTSEAVSEDTSASDSESDADAIIDDGTIIDGDYTPDSPGNVNLPNLTTDDVITSAADTNDDVVMQGSIADYDSSYGVAVVNSTQYAVYQKEQNTFLAKLSNIASGAIDHFFSLSLRGPTGRGNPVISTAYADTSGCFTDNSYITEITVTSEGIIDPQAIANYNSGDELKIFYFDTTTCETGTETAVDVIENLLYVAQESAGRRGIAADSAGNINQTDASGNVINIAASEEEGFVVQNSFDTNFVMASVGSSVSALAYNTSASDFIFQSSELVSAYDYSAGVFTGVMDSSTICVTANGCSPVAVKNKNDKSYFITELDESVPAGETSYIRELYDDSNERIQFLTGSELDAHSRPIRFRSAKAFDVVVGETKNQYLVIFEDGRGIMRLFGEIKDLSSAEVVTSRLDSSFSETKDIIIFSAQSEDDSNDGEALLYTSDKIYFITYDSLDASCTDEEIEEGDCDNPSADGTSISVDTSNPISISNLVSVVVNDEGTYAYALADDTIHVINLASHTTESTIALADVIGHDVSFDASAILYTSVGETDYLVVSSDSLKAAIVVDLSQSYE